MNTNKFGIRVRILLPAISAAALLIVSALGYFPSGAAAQMNEDLSTIFWNRIVSNTAAFSKARLFGASDIGVNSDDGSPGVLNDAIASACTPPPANMTAWYAGDGNGLDLQGGDSATLSGNAGSVTIVPGKVAQAFQFNGGGELRVADSPALDVAAAFTLDAWLNPTAGNDFSYILFKENGGFGSYALFLQNDRRINFRIGVPSSADAIASNTQIPLDSYTHVAATYDGTTMRIYINGNLDASKTTTFVPANSNGELRIGAGYRGAIDELEIFNRALAQSEIQAIVAADSFGKCKPFTPPPPPPTNCITPPASMTAWYAGDGNAVDLQGGDSGTLNGNQGSVAFAPGKVAQAFQFSGAGDVRVNDAPAHDATTALTLDAWVNPTAANGGSIVFKGNTGSAGGQPYSLFVNPDRTVTFRVGNASTFDALGSFARIPLNAYSHIAATYDGTRMRIYVNGNLDAIKTTTVGTLANSDLPLLIGTFGYQGAIDELEIFNRVLSLSEIQLLFVADSFGKCKSASPPSPTPTRCITPPANMTAWYAGDGNLEDFQNGNNGMVSGSGVTFATGKVAQAIQFNGSGDVRVNDAPAHDATTALTLDAWINPSAANGGSIVFKGNTGSAGGQPYSLFVNPDRTVTFRVGNASTFDALSSFARIPLNAYSHIAATYDGTRMRIYINGNLNAVKMTNIGTLANSDLPLFIGTFSYQGAIDELEIFNRVLSLSEIQLLVAADSFGKCKCPVIALNPSSLPGATLNAAYSQPVTPSAGTTPFTFAVTSGALPPGLTLDVSTGIISGTPTTTAGSPFNFTIRAADANDCSGSRAYSIAVTCLLTLSPPTLPGGRAGAFYNQTINASGSGGGAVTYAVTSGALPSGLTLNSSTGQISGTPTTAETANFTVTATAAGGCSGSRAYSIVVDPAPPACLQPPSGIAAWLPGDDNANDISGNNNHGTLQNGATFAPGKVGRAFSLDGVDDHVLVNHSPSLATTALTIDLWAYPTAYGTHYNRLVEKGGAAAFDTGGYSLEFNPCPNSQPNCSGDSGQIAFVIWSDSFGVFVPLYSTDTVALNAWTHIAATFDGSTMALYINGVPQGTMTASMGGTTDNLAVGKIPNNDQPFYFPGRIDELDIFNRALSQSEIQAIFAAGSAGKCKPCSTISFSPAALPNGTVDSPYSQTVAASGGIAPYYYAVTSGGLPPGLNLNPSTGIISGTPTANAGNPFNFVITATDANNCSNARAYSISVVCPSGGCIPTAASVTVGGRAMMPNGKGIARARVTLTDANGTTRYAQTNFFGFYRFERVEAGQTYILSVSHKSHQFAQATQVLFVSEDLTGIDFTASP